MRPDRRLARSGQPGLLGILLPLGLHPQGCQRPCGTGSACGPISHTCRNSPRRRGRPRYWKRGLRSPSALG
eukprot:1782342-Heterocapsa_arctica.AAC.1